MRLKKLTKDNLAGRGADLALVESRSQSISADDPLRFWTLHETKPCLVDLTDLASGQESPKKPGLEDRWIGAYTGRPALIRELAPAIKEKLLWATKSTCDGNVANLKSWWRLFDEMENAKPDSEIKLAPISSVSELSHLHQQLAVQRFSPGQFSSFRSIADVTRRSLGLHPLTWTGPESIRPKRRLPIPDQSRVLFTHIKRAWLKVVDRWNLVDAMLEGAQQPSSEKQVEWLHNAQFFSPWLEGRELPNAADVVQRWTKDTGLSKRRMLESGLCITTMYAAYFPTAFEIRMAFHLALIGGGWNIQTLLDLRVNVDAKGDERTPFLKNHPQDANRYIMVGFKERGATDHILHGDWKSDRSPGRIIRTLIERTWPLREMIIQQLQDAKLQLDALVRDRASDKIQNLARLKVLELQRKSTSVWLYIGRQRIEALNSESYDKIERNKPILHLIIERINSERPTAMQVLPLVRASDFRDIFAEYVYRTSGGSVLAVKRLLGHRSLSSTTKYLDNTVINKSSEQTFKCFANEMWDMLATSGRVDHTVLRQVVDEGSISPAQLLRLEEYRNLKKSRLGIGCKNPTDPPARLDPHFKADGKALCTMHRCTLCVENAVIAPEALEGLTMRLAELRYLKNKIPIEHFSRGEDTSFQAEMNNTTVALLAFEDQKVELSVQKWIEKIQKDIHRVPEFHGVSRKS